MNRCNGACKFYGDRSYTYIKIVHEMFYRLYLWVDQMLLHTDSSINGLDDRGSIPGRGSDGIFSLRHHVQTDSEAHPAPYPMDTGDSYPRNKIVGV
jgi:hypothetical protein